MRLRTFTILCGLLSIWGCNEVKEFSGCRSDAECAVGQACRGGTCVAKSTVDTTCDGVDDDQDGNIDENASTNIAADRLRGVCHAARKVCQNGAWSEPDYIAIEGYDGDDTNCDGLDNDCDGKTDEGFTEQASGCGRGACAAVGRVLCVQGEAIDTCEAGQEVAPDDTTCDGVDDDCDGGVDENYMPTPSVCGTGFCVVESTTVCVDGAVDDNCTPGGRNSSDDANCDGVDDDCDGENDEDYVSVESQCGAGVCAATGTTRCEDGVAVDVCQPGQRHAIGDVTCDGLDDDCDGQTDESYAAVATSCGVGECAAVGVTACIDGGIVDSCVAGGPRLDENCDGLDQDCDGRTDEGYPSTETRCGLGVCAVTGRTACLNGAVVNNCQPADPVFADDARCDGLNDDCDGQTDEDYVSQPTVCGDGQCRRTGHWVCENGSARNTCEPGGPGPERRELCSEADIQRGDCCDGIDDDCNGRIDEGLGCTHCPPGAQGVPCNGCNVPGGVSVPDGWVCIPAGQQDMGQPGVGWDCGDCGDVPEYQVEITRPFLMMKTELTQHEFGGLPGGPDDNSIHLGCPQCPVDSITLQTVFSYLARRSEVAALPACYTPADNGFLTWAPEDRLCHGYRLPTEAEWEYAARAGLPDRGVWWQLDQLARNTVMWTTLNSTIRASERDAGGEIGCLNRGDDGYCLAAHPVGLLAMSPWGLFDMLGNVKEATYGNMFDRFVGEGPYVDPVNGLGVPSNSLRSPSRGGSFSLRPENYGNFHTRRGRGPDPDTGFRVVRTIPQPGDGEAAADPAP